MLFLAQNGFRSLRMTVAAMADPAKPLRETTWMGMPTIWRL